MSTASKTKIAEEHLTIDGVKNLLSYDRDTGVFKWKKSRGGKLAGAIAGCQLKNGYWHIGINKIYFLAHRLAWFIETGQWPLADTDHINGDKIDNRFANLREATRSQNNANTGKPRHNTSGFKGVSWSKRRRKWLARIVVNKKAIEVGFFNNKIDAAVAYKKAAKMYYREFART